MADSAVWKAELSVRRNQMSNDPTTPETPTTAPLSARSNGDQRQPDRAVRHVNLLAWKEGTDQVAIDALSEHLSKYAEEIPEIRGLSFGPDLALAEGNLDFAIIVDFEDDEAFARYLAHPAHGRMVNEFLKPILEARRAIQYRLASV